MEKSEKYFMEEEAKADVSLR